MAIKPQSARAKGRKGQQIIRDLILEIFPELEPDDCRSTAMGQAGEDVQLSPAARKLLPYQIESKNKARSQIHSYYEQAKTHGEYEPLVFVKQDRKEMLAIVEARHFLELLRKTKDFGNSRSNS